MARVELIDLCKIYDPDLRVVDNVNITIEDQEFVVFVGPSGCGKTTTLRMIAGLEEIDDGHIKIDGGTVNHIAPKNRDIAMVFQNYALYPHMTVYENMAFGLKMRKYPKSEIDARVREAAEILGINELLKRKPKALSGGQRQRVAVGRAIVRKPKVFLFDEPLSNLDAKLRTQMRTELSKLHKKLQSTMIYVTHDQIEAMTMADKIVVIRNGKVQQIGSPLELYNKPANMFVAGFIGSPQMCFFDVETAIKQDKVVLRNKDLMMECETPKNKECLAGGKVTLGVRPENVSINRDESGNENSFRGVVDFLEQLGDEMITYVSTSFGRLVAKLSPDEKITYGDQINLCFDDKKLHFFDCETQNRIN